MKRVNLLPAWYIRQQHERSRLRVRFTLLVCGMLTLVAWIGFQKSHMASLERRQAMLLAQLNELHHVDADLAAAKSELNKAEVLRAAYHELGPTVPMSALLQQVQNDLEPGMMLSRVSIDVRDESPRQVGPVDVKSRPKPRPIARVTAVGFAPNDVLIANVIGRYSANPLLSEVTLNYSRPEVVQDYAVRRFEIQMVIDLSRLHAEETQSMQQASVR